MSDRHHTIHERYINDGGGISPLDSSSPNSLLCPTPRRYRSKMQRRSKPSISSYQLRISRYGPHHRTPPTRHGSHPNCPSFHLYLCYSSTYSRPTGQALVFSERFRRYYCANLLRRSHFRLSSLQAGMVIQNLSKRDSKGWGVPEDQVYWRSC